MAEPNRPPQPAGAIPALEVFVGDSAVVEVTGHFRDADGDALAHGAVSSEPAVAAVRVAGGTVVVRGVAQGAATVTVTATDPGGLSGTQTFAVAVPNLGPEAVGELPGVEVMVGDSVAIELSVHFADPDGDGLSFAATSSDTSVAGVAVAGDKALVAARAKGAATITVAARDAGGLEARHTFGVTVPNRAPIVLEALPGGRLVVGDTARTDLSLHFSDPDADSLRFAATTSAARVATATVTGTTLAVAALAPDTAAITVTATDPDGLAASLAFTTIVPNRAPEPFGTIPDTTVTIGDTIRMAVSPHFRDPDGDSLAYAARTSRRIRVTATLARDTVTLAALSVGNSAITLTATDPGGLPATQRFRVAVEPPPVPDLVVDSVRVDADSIVPGASLTLNAHVRNRGDGDAPSQATLRFVISWDPRIDNADAQVDTAAIPQLGAGAARAAAVTVTGPTATGAYYYGACVVPVEGEPETGNNCSEGVRIRVWQPNRAPEAVGTISGRQLDVGASTTFRASPYFTDPDGDELRYTAASSAPSIATAFATGGAVTVTGLAAGSATVTVTARDPRGLAATQSFEVRVVERATLSPDLVVASFSASAGSVGRDDVFTLHATVRNQGTASSPPTTLRYYTSLDAQIGTADDEIGTGGVGALDPGQTHTTSLDVVAPSGGGTYYYGACVDALASQPATANNCSDVFAVEVLAGNRAPRAVGVVSGRAVITGGNVSVEIAGHFDDADGDPLTYSATSSDTLTATAEMLGTTVVVAAIGVGTATITVTAADPAGLTAAHSFAVSVAEETTPLPDLVVESPVLDVTGVVQPGARFTLSVEVRNLGPGGAAATTLRYYRSADATITTLDSEVDTDEVGALAANRSSAESATLSAPAEAGTWYYGACVDGVGEESNVANNCSGAATIQVVDPNRAPVAVGSIGSQTVMEGDESVVDATAFFTDPDMDPLVYSVSSSVPDTVSVTVDDSEVTFKGQGLGRSTITVTARDPGGLAASQSFLVTVTGPNRPPRVSTSIADVDNVHPNEQFHLSLLAIFTDPDGDELTYTTSNTNPAVATVQVVNDIILVLRTLSVGTASLSVTATDPEGLSATEDWHVTVVAPPPPVFDIDLAFTSDVTEAQKVQIRAARDAWEGILGGTELSDITFNSEVSCRGVSATVGTVDDHLVLVDVTGIDGPQGTLALAVYCRVRVADGTPVLSTILFDEDDIPRVRNLGSLDELALHEMAHGLGFLGGYWEDRGLLEVGNDPHFTGALAVEAFDSAGGTGYTGNKVPVSSPNHNHWRESVLGSELMTPRLVVGGSIPISAITIQSMADIGYTVDASLAEDYDLPGSRPPGAVADEHGEVLDLGNDVVPGPVVVVGPDGRTIRTIPAPAGYVVPSRPRRRATIELRMPPVSRPSGGLADPPAADSGAVTWRRINNPPPPEGPGR